MPNLSADIRIAFLEEEYIGRYLSHGKSKTVFVMRSNDHNKNRFDGNVLKISRERDIEPAIAMVATEITRKLSDEGIGKDEEVEYHCWVMERCIPLNHLAALNICDKDQCVLAACRQMHRKGCPTQDSFIRLPLL